MSWPTIAYDSLTVDTIQTAAIFFIGIVICSLWLRRERLSNREHRDLQDVIASQWVILQQLTDQKLRIDGLSAEMADRCEEIFGRLTNIERRHNDIDSHHNP